MAERGLSITDLKTAKERFEKEGCHCELVDLGQDLEAGVLIIRNGVSHILSANSADKTVIHNELSCLSWDTKAKMKGRVVNKHARHNLCFGEQGQEPLYEQGKGRIVGFSHVPQLQFIRARLIRYFDLNCTLQAEGNLYFDKNTCGIGFHGDAERRVVIAMRLGASLPLHFQWFQRSQAFGERIILQLNDGDMYAMSEKATGNDWLKKTIKTLRHATGAPKYLQIKAKNLPDSGKEGKAKAI